MSWCLARRSENGRANLSPDGPGPFPTLFASSAYRYDNNILPAYPMFLWRETGPIEWHVEKGYAYVHATPAALVSRGEYEFFGRREQHDLYDISEQFARTEEERTTGFSHDTQSSPKDGCAPLTRRSIRSAAPGNPILHAQKNDASVPRKIYKIEIPLQPIAYRFRRERIRLEIANGDSPVTDNLFFTLTGRTRSVPTRSTTTRNIPRSWFASPERGLKSRSK